MCFQIPRCNAGSTAQWFMKMFCFSIYFVNKVTLAVHLKTKVHRKRLKELRFAPHSQDEADRAAGMGNFHMPTERVIRKLTVDDQIRDERFIQEENMEEDAQINTSLFNKPVTGKKRKQSVFIAIKSKNQST